MKKFIVMAGALLIFSGFAYAQQTLPAHSKAQPKNEVKKGKESTKAENDKPRKITDSSLIKIKVPPMAPDTVGIPKKED